MMCGIQKGVPGGGMTLILPERGTFLPVIPVPPGIQCPVITQDPDTAAAEDLDPFLRTGFIPIGKIIHRSHGAVFKKQLNGDVIFVVFS